jgi:hypothetical protein
MRNNWNFSHVVTPRSEAFGSHDASTTGNGVGAFNNRAQQLKDKWIRETAETRDANGNKIGFENAKALYQQKFGS